MSMQHDVVLTLGSSGRAIDVWDGYEITIDMLAPGEPFTFKFWHSDDAQSTWDYLLANIKLFDTVILTIDGAPQLNGVIEVMKIHEDAQGGAEMVISGRSPLGAANDWDANPAVSLRNTTLEQVVVQVLTPFLPASSGVGGTGAPAVITGADADDATQMQTNTRVCGRRPHPHPARHHRTHSRANPIDRFHPKPGEKALPLVQQMCCKLGYRLWSAPDAANGIAVIIDVPRSSGTPAYTLTRKPVQSATGVWDGNIEAGGYELNGRNIPTTVHMMAHASRGDGNPARYLTNVGTPYVGDSRLFTIPAHDVYRVAERARTSAGAAQEANRLMGDANANFEVHEYTVQGHGQQAFDGTVVLWGVNCICHVRDDLTGINKDLLITRVAFKGGRDHGQSTSLRMVPLGVLTLVPEPVT